MCQSAEHSLLGFPEFLLTEKFILNFFVYLLDTVQIECDTYELLRIQFMISTSWLSKLQYYHGNPDWSCPQNPVAGLPWCPVIWGDYILRIQATISNISRVVDQVCALKCTVVGSNPPMRPVHYQEVRSRPLKYARDFIFDPFL